MTTYERIAALAEFAKGWLTILIAGLAVFIAYQQWKTNERRAVLDRYDRRFRIYQRVIEFIRLSCRDFKPPFPEIIRFHQDVLDADFLFGPEIPAYLDELRRHAIDSATAHAEFCDLTMIPPPGYDANDVTKRMNEHSVWLTNQIDVAREKFRKYLDVSR